MDWLNVVGARLRALFRRESVLQDIEEELRSHVEMATEANIARGMAPREARAAALKSFGNSTQINLPPQKYAAPAARAAFLEQTLARLRALPGVENAGAAHRLPLAGNSGTSFDIEGRSVAEGMPRLRAIYRAISPDYFRAMGTPLIAGRTFTDEEAWRQPTAVIINQTLARRYWPDETPLGKRLKVGSPNSAWVEIIGVGLGLLAAFALTRWLNSLLFGVSATDPLIFGGIALILTLVALLACWIPARRASRVDPMVALRYE